jgi:hypothetical protein
MARGFTPVAQNGFFSSDPSKAGARLPNVPVVFLRLGDVRVWAQIDTGYEDFVYSRSIDINQALFDRLVANGAKLLVSNGGCLACHAIKGNPMMQGNIGPNLTHVATRTTTQG